MESVSSGTLTPAVTPPLNNPMVAFRTHFVIFAVVLAMLGVLNYMSGPPYWVLYVLAGWGIGIVAHGLAASRKRS